MSNSGFSKGLEGVVAAESTICKVDGENGRLYYLGYSIRDLVEHCTFEEVTFLLLYGQLPNEEQLEDFSSAMRSKRKLEDPVKKMITDFPRDSHPMEMLQTVVPYLAAYSGPEGCRDTEFDCLYAEHLIPQLSSAVAAWHRVQQGLPIVDPDNSLSHGANFLYMLNGEKPSELAGRIMDGCLILHAEHGLNASTFTARVVASTLSTCYSAIAAAIGALYGPLHGGANEKVMEMVDEIESNGEISATDWVNTALDEKRKVMGMGHRVYRAKDPRAIIIEGYLEELGKQRGDTTYFDMLKEVERVFRERMEEKGKPIYPNVDFFSGAVYRMLGVPTILFTPIFALSRASGWLSHIIEQRHDNRIYRPSSTYTGEIDRPFIPMADRK